MKSERDFTWTPNLAYVVGLITTDGCLSCQKGKITFTSKDIDLINSFKRILKLNNKIGKTINARSFAYRIQFCNVKLYRWLLSIGLTPHKSKTIGPIKIPRRLFIDFLRGHLDGDGCITRYTDRYNTYKNPKYVYERLSIRFVSASERHVQWLNMRIIKILKIKGCLHTSKLDTRTGNTMYILKFGKMNSLKLLEKIYYSPNLPCLDRKRILAQQCLTSPLLLPKKSKSPIVRV